MKYQTWCAWKLFKPTLTQQEESVEISHLSVLSVNSSSAPDSDITIVEISENEPKSWMSKFKRESTMMHSIRNDDESLTIIESNAIVYSGSPPTYRQSHLDNSS